MKEQSNLSFGILCLVLIIGFFIAIAETNYQQARIEARMDGTDLGIEMAYYRHGFNIEALDTTIPPLPDRLGALLKIKNQQQ